MAVQSPIDTTGIVKATQTAAEAGTSDSVWMSPLKTKQAIDALSPNRNLVINGDFESWQEGDFVSVASAAYFADVWQFYHTSSAVFDVAQNASVPTLAESGHNSNSSMLFTITTADASLAAGDLLGVGHKIEGKNFKAIDGKNATISFWIRSSKTGTYAVSLRNSVPDRSYVHEYTVDVADTWEKKTFTVAMDTGGTWLTDTGIGMWLFFTFAAGTNWNATAADTWEAGNYISTANVDNGMDNTANNFYLSQVKVEEGSVATAFGDESIQDTLAKIGRYLIHRAGAASEFICDMQCANATTAFGYLNHKVQMRADPTLTVSNAADFTVAHRGTAAATTALVITTTGQDEYASRLTATTTGLTTGSGAALVFDAAGSRWLTLSARL